MKKLLLLPIAILGIFSLVAFHAEALTVSPAKIEINADPGTIVSGEFLVVNEESETKTFYTSSENFQAQGETGAPNFVVGQDGLASWVKVEPQVILSKNEQKKVPFTISVPKGADAGGHFAAIFLSTVPPKGSSNQVSVGAKIGILLLLHVTGPVKEGGGLLDFSTKNRARFFTSLPVAFSYRFQNSGNDRVKPAGTLKIKNMIGLTSAEFAGNPSEGNILPNSTRKFDLVWNGSQELEAGPVGFLGALKNEWHNFAFGYYVAHLDLSYGTKPDSASLTSSFFVLPWHFLIVVLAALALVLLILFRGIKSYNRWIIEKSRSAL